MAIPILGNLVANAAGSIPTAVLDSFMSPIKYGAAAKFWKDTPIIVPAIDAVLHAFLRGHLTSKQTADICRIQGCNIFGDEIVKRGIFGNEARDNGEFAASWNDLLGLYRQYLTPDQLNEAHNRDFLLKSEWENGLVKYGGYRSTDINIMRKLRDVVPPSSDILRFSHKEAFQPLIANKYRFYDEYPAYAEQWMKAHGYDWGPGFKIIRDGKEVNAKWLDLYNAAEWQPISPTQAYRFTHKIRQYWIDKGRWPGLDLQPWGQTETAEWLRIADYPPGVRPYLIADSYNVLGRIDLRKMVRVGFIRDNAEGREEVLNRYMDMGFTQLDSKGLTDYTFLTESPGNKINKGYTRYRSQILQSYRVGIVDRPAAEQMLQGPIANHPQLAELTRENALLLDSVDIESQHKLVSRAIAALRADFLEGSIGIEQARTQLINMGILEKRRNELIASWRIDMTRPRRVLSITKAIDLYRRRLISREQLATRGRNLGYSEIDLNLLMAAADQDTQKAMIDAELRAQKQQKAAIKESHREADHGRLHALWDLQDTIRVTPPSLLGREFKSGVIDESTIRDRLESMEWDDEWIDRFVQLNRPS